MASHAWAVRLHSASWYVAVVGALVALANAVFGLHLDAGSLDAAAGIIASLVLGSAVAVHGTAQAAASPPASKAGL